MSTKDFTSILSSAGSHLADTVRVCLSSRKKSELRAVCTAAVSNLDNLLANWPKSRYNSDKRNVRFAINCLNGVLNGLSSGTITLPELRRAVGSIPARNSFQSLSADINKKSTSSTETSQVTVDVIPSVEPPKSTGDFKTDLAVIASVLRQQEDQRIVTVQKLLDKPAGSQDIYGDPDPEDKNTDEEEDDGHDYGPTDGPGARFSADDEHLMRQLEHLNEQRTALPVTIKGDFQLVIAPVVPIFETSRTEDASGRRPYSVARNFSQNQRLVRLGIQHLTVNDYLVLVSQPLLAVRTDVISEMQDSLQEHADQDFADKRADFKKWQKSHDPEVMTKEAQKAAGRELRLLERRKEKELSAIEPDDDVGREAVEIKYEKQIAALQSNKKKYVASLRKEIKALQAAVAKTNTNWGVCDRKRTALEKNLDLQFRRFAKTQPDNPEFSHKRKSEIDLTPFEVSQRKFLQADPEWKRLTDKMIRLKKSMDEGKKLISEKTTEAAKVESGGEIVVVPATKVQREAPKRRKIDSSPAAVAEELLATINERSHVQYELVVKQPIRNPRNANISMFWIMPSRVLSNLTKGGGWKKIVDWGFPFK